MISKVKQIVIEANKRGYVVNKEGDVYSPKGIKRKLRKDKNGYLYFSIRMKDGKVRHVFVHRLQSYQKYGNTALYTECTRHLDGNKENNSFTNIEIGSIMDNWMDIPKKRRIEICATANQKYDVRVVKEIRDEYKKGKRMKYLMNKYGITSKGTFSHILNKRLINY